MTTYKSQNGNTYKFKNENHRFSLPGMRGEFTAKKDINNARVMEKLINLNSPSIVLVSKAEVDDSSANADLENTPSVKPLTVKELTALIEEAESVEAINALVPEGEERKGVLSAVEKRTAELGANSGEGENTEE